MTRLESELKFTVACKSISKKEKKLGQLIMVFVILKEAVIQLRFMQT